MRVHIHTEQNTTWEPYLRVMLEHGCDVIAINYRGSSGYGQRFEKMGSEAERVQDVLAARDYAVKSLGIEPARVYLTGISHGAGLAAAAAAQQRGFGGVILVSWAGPVEGAFENPAKDRLDNESPSVKIVELHGQLDAVLPPAEARRSLQQFLLHFGRRAAKPRWRVLDDEGHFFYSAASWARVYWEALTMIEAKQ